MWVADGPATLALLVLCSMARPSTGLFMPFAAQERTIHILNGLLLLVHCSTTFRRNESSLLSAQIDLPLPLSGRHRLPLPRPQPRGREEGCQRSFKPRAFCRGHGIAHFNKQQASGTRCLSWCRCRARDVLANKHQFMNSPASQSSNHFFSS